MKKVKTKNKKLRKCEKSKIKNKKWKRKKNGIN